MQILFRDFRRFVARLDRVSICIHETQRYRNYNFIHEVPEDYDDFYVFGVGQIESEFKCSSNRPGVVLGEVITEGIEYLPCLEIMLSEKPREFTE